ncbi:hypothetical protein DL89DRAFT_44974 [Linderina pennispora]|uniref:Uncharacterized protein n=1 Tax=Linderina pennispora TaxID=61395 RepID=A0A1Y1W2U1_9FUNG|nr:uncharacterized protein DL89DRAFT_44974 [Linderina pennispora]ORX67464.1 hypothetical protein DL89DRAFT_44974 [Linderina pennispora]
MESECQSQHFLRVVFGRRSENRSISSLAPVVCLLARRSTNAASKKAHRTLYSAGACLGVAVGRVACPSADVGAQQDLKHKTGIMASIGCASARGTSRRRNSGRCMRA